MSKFTDIRDSIEDWIHIHPTAAIGIVSFVVGFVLGKVG